MLSLVSVTIIKYYQQLLNPRVEFVQNHTQNKEHGAHRLLSASLEVVLVPAERSCE